MYIKGSCVFFAGKHDVSFVSPTQAVKKWDSKARVALRTFIEELGVFFAG